MLIYIISGCVVFLSTQYLMHFLQLKNISDKPNKRTNHVGIVLRGGGMTVVGLPLLVFFIIIIGILYRRNYNASTTIIIKGYSVFTAITLLSIVFFFIEDVKQNIHILLRLLFQIFISVILIFVLKQDILSISIFKIFPQWFVLTMMTIFIVGFINIYNFMDGIDFITITETASISLGGLILTTLGMEYFYVHGSEYINCMLLSILLKLILSGMFAFSFFNKPPAKLFIGDSGSITLGLVMAFVLIKLAAIFNSILILILLPLYYLIDSSVTIMKRIYRKEKIWKAHSSHYYQLAKRNGKSVEYICLAIFKINIIFMLIVVLLHYVHNITVIVIVLCSGLLSLFLTLRDFARPCMSNK